MTTSSTSTVADVGSAPEPAIGNVSGKRSFLKKHGFIWGLLTPILVFFIVFNIIPLLWMVGMSFYRYVLTSGMAPVSVGLGNYQDLLSSQDMWGAFRRTLGFVLLTVLGASVLGILLGLLFWRSTKMPGRRVALTLLFAPMLLTPVAVGAFYRLMLEPNFGVISYFVSLVTGRQQNLLASPGTAYATVLAIDIWMWTPFMALITLAALASVPQAELEASRVDRLRPLAVARRVILPHAKFILMLGVLLRTIDAFKTTDQVLLLTNGGPGNITDLLGVRLYRIGFDSLDMGVASTVAVVALFVAIGFTTLYLYVLNLRKKGEA